jgi:hypothetical protein
MSNALTTQLRQSGAAVAVHPDTDRYKNRFDVRSGSSNRIYRISYDAAPGAGYWVCSCPGCIRHGDCKHLRAVGLQGRKYGRVSLEASIKRALNG